MNTNTDKQFDQNHSKLIEHPWMNMYFVRCTTWKWYNNSQIEILSGKENIPVVLDEWQTLVFHEANTNQSCAELILFLAARYSQKEEIPADLDQIILRSVEFLVEDVQAVRMTSSKMDIPEEYEFPQE
ncbi:MAG TPA: hypothetical protein DCY91_29775 [Cyanobacteria bacterium UBA11370]|nr:hypothetical protein [Cyanobacteria bacterium UBA11370]HBY78820.1 hypothetical protein [Cyanobacteria bacterium UBA11148]